MNLPSRLGRYIGHVMPRSLPRSNRSSLLRTSILALTFLAANSAMAVDCSNFDDYKAGNTYTGGMKVKHGGTGYNAEWWTQARDPDRLSHGALRSGPLLRMQSSEPCLRLQSPKPCLRLSSPEPGRSPPPST